MDLTYPYDYLGAGPDSLADLAGSSAFGDILRKAEHPLVIVGQGALARPDGAAVLSLAARVVIMGAGPALRIIGQWRVPIPRPRDIDVRLEPAFHHLHREIWAALKDEVVKGYRQSEVAS